MARQTGGLGTPESEGEVGAPVREPSMPRGDCTPFGACAIQGNGSSLAISPSSPGQGRMQGLSPELPSPSGFCMNSPWLASQLDQDQPPRVRRTSEESNVLTSRYWPCNANNTVTRADPVRSPQAGGQSLRGNKRLTDGLEENDDENRAPSTTEPPKKRMGISSKPPAKARGRGGKRGVKKHEPTAASKSRSRGRVSNRRDVSEDPNESYHEGSPDQDTLRQTTEGGGRGGSNRGGNARGGSGRGGSGRGGSGRGGSSILTRPARTAARPKAAVAEASASATPAPPSSSPGNSASARFISHVITPQLAGIRQALGDANWNEYVKLVEQMVIQGAITEGELDRRARRLFRMSNEKLWEKVQKMMVKMVRYSHNDST
jgi:hypothetical protein